jgi:hypothetical protein
MFFTALMSGCKKSNQLDVAPVTGIVTLDGKPVSGGVVVFQPARGRGATGIISSDGKYFMRTYREADGAIVGLNKIAVSSSGKMPTIEEQEAGTVNIKQNLPGIYTSPETSGLSFSVEAGKENHFDIKLFSTK